MTTELRKLTEREVLDALDLARDDAPGQIAHLPDFSLVDLTGLDLRTVPLKGATFQRARLVEADLSNADASSCDFSQADLNGTKLIGTQLTDANFSGAVLQDANLCGACLYQADLRGTDLRGCNLDWADVGDVRVDQNTRVRSEQLAKARNVPESLIQQARTLQPRTATATIKTPAALARGDDEGAIARSIREAIGTATTDYQAVRSSLLEIAGDTHREIARILQPLINAHAATLPQATYDEKKVVAKWVNSEIWQLGLVLKAPDTGHPCVLTATPGDSAEVGRFVLDYVDEQGKRQHRMSSATLPLLELIPNDPSRSPFGQRSSRDR